MPVACVNEVVLCTLARDYTYDITYCMHGIPAEILNWRLIVYDGCYPFSYHWSFNYVHV